MPHIGKVVNQAKTSMEQRKAGHGASLSDAKMRRLVAASNVSNQNNNNNLNSNRSNNKDSEERFVKVKIQEIPVKKFLDV